MFTVFASSILAYSVHCPWELVCQRVATELCDLIEEANCALSKHWHCRDTSRTE